MLEMLLREPSVAGVRKRRDEGLANSGGPDSSPAATGIERDATDDAIRRALSADSRVFNEATQQAGGE